MPNEYGQWVPDPLAPSGYRWARHGEQPATSMLPIVRPTPYPRDELPDVPPRVDDWCEDRPPLELTDLDELE